MKFGTEVVLESGQGCGGRPSMGTGCFWSLRGTFWQKLYKTKVAKTLMIQWGQVTISGPKFKSGRPWDPGPSEAMVTQTEGQLIKNVVVYVINSYLVRLDTPYPDPRSLVGFWSLSCAFWHKLFNTKVGEHPQLSGNGSPVWTPNPNLEGPGPMSFWSCGPHHRDRLVAAQRFSRERTPGRLQ